MATQTVRSSTETVIEKALAGERLTVHDGYRLIASRDPAGLTALMAAACELNDRARPHRRVTYSRKVFLPLTNLCRDRCGYCTFVKGPRQRGAHTMTPDEVLAVARRGAELGCKEALLSLGDHPEERHPEMREMLRDLGFDSTPEYTAAMSRLVLEEAGLLPHTNCGTLDRDEMAAIAPWNASMGIMLESASLRLHESGGPHHGTVTKRPEQRIATLETAAELGVAMTTGILIGIGETPEERVDALLAIRDVQERCGNVQEVIVQNFRAKPGTRMRGAPEPSALDMLRTLARRPVAARPGDEHPGPAQPAGRRLRDLPALRHQRLGRRLPADEGLHQPRGGMARHRPPARPDPRGRLRATGAHRALSLVRPRRRVDAFAAGRVPAWPS